MSSLFLLYLVDLGVWPLPTRRFAPGPVSLPSPPLPSTLTASKLQLRQFRRTLRKEKEVERWLRFWSSACCLRCGTFSISTSTSTTSRYERRLSYIGTHLERDSSSCLLIWFLISLLYYSEIAFSTCFTLVFCLEMENFDYYYLSSRPADCWFNQYEVCFVYCSRFACLVPSDWFYLIRAGFESSSRPNDCHFSSVCRR